MICQACWVTLQPGEQGLCTPCKQLNPVEQNLLLYITSTFSRYEGIMSYLTDCPLKQRLQAIEDYRQKMIEQSLQHLPESKTHDLPG